MKMKRPHDRFHESKSRRALREQMDEAAALDQTPYVSVVTGKSSIFVRDCDSFVRRGVCDLFRRKERERSVPIMSISIKVDLSLFASLFPLLE